MKWRTRFLGVALGVMSAALMAQQASSSQTTTTTTSTTVTGSVVSYSPGQSIVVKSADGKTTTYMLGPSVQVPAEVQVGRSVTLSTQPGSNGAQATVTRVEVKSSNPADSSGPSGSSSSSSSSAPSSSSDTSSMSGQSSSSGASSQSTTQSTTQTDMTMSSTPISGKVTAYQPKQSITIEQPGKGTVTYVIDAQSDLPQDVAVGKTVTITTTTVQGSSKPVVRTVTTTTKTTKSTSESHPQ